MNISQLAEIDIEICSIVRISTQRRMNTSPFSEIVSALIELIGRLEHTPNETIPEKMYIRLAWVDEGEGASKGQRIFFQGVHFDNFSLKLPIEVWVIPLIANRNGVSSGLLLVPTVGDSYKRVGTCFNITWASFNQLHEVHITIV